MLWSREKPPLPAENRTPGVQPIDFQINALSYIGHKVVEA
jgi:hypothetical protein